jgi:hypothetical protein
MRHRGLIERRSFFLVSMFLLLPRLNLISGVDSGGLWSF